MDITTQDAEGLLLAALLGAIIGIDREYRGKPAGFRTLMLVSMGAALFTIVSFKMALKDPNGESDVTRIASNIVVGIGFLGAGIIFRNAENVKGLTTAASTWMAAAIGMTAGIGSFALAILATVITWITLFVLHYVEHLTDWGSTTVRYTIKWQPSDSLPAIQEHLGAAKFKLKEEKFRRKAGSLIAEWTVKANKATHQKLIDLLVKDDRVTDLDY